jgi:transcriptional regulator with XRE-family HTH domain
MTFSNEQIRKLRQRLGWSLAEMARQMGCSTDLISAWETGSSKPDQDAVNQLCFLQGHVDEASVHTLQAPLAEVEMETRGMAQLTHTDLLKDVQ